MPGCQALQRGKSLRMLRSYNGALWSASLTDRDTLPYHFAIPPGSIEHHRLLPAELVAQGSQHAAWAVQAP